MPEEFGVLESEPDVEVPKLKSKNKIATEETKVNSLPLFKPNTNDFGFKKGKPLRPYGMRGSPLSSSPSLVQLYSLNLQCFTIITGSYLTVQPSDNRENNEFSNRNQFFTKEVGLIKDRNIGKHD